MTLSIAANTSATASSPGTHIDTTYRRWEPLPKVEYGFAVSPFVPELESLDLTTIEGSVSQLETPPNLAVVQSHLIGLEVGDEVYIFEQLGHKDISWVRGYVVSTVRVPVSATTSSSLSDYSTFPSTNTAGSSHIDEPQVYVGIFPKANMHVKEYLDDAEMRLSSIYAKAIEDEIVGATEPTLPKLPSNHMETLPEEDENIVSPPGSPRHTQGKSTDSSSQSEATAGQSKITFNPSRQSFILQDPNIDEDRPPPPLPSLKCGDETKSGMVEPLVDEIACALREWSTLMYGYLSRRDYTLFQAVREHIEVLHVARRQLLAQTLSEEELGKLRRECVARLVKANVQQGLDVIVRHPGRGGLVDVDSAGKESDAESWISGIRLFGLQAALAYVDQQARTEKNSLGASNAFGIDQQFTSLPSGSNIPITGGTSRSRKALARQNTLKKNPRSSTTSNTASDDLTKINYFHVYLDVRAFVASPCAPGELAELYFSLYSRTESRFITEEYCIILNHHGVPAKDPSSSKLGKMRTIFTDLSLNDLQDVHIVCRIVRNGSMRMSVADTRRSGQAADSITSPAVVEKALLSPGQLQSAMTSEHSIRRPFGCAVMELGQDHQFQIDIASSSPLREHVMPIFVPIQETAFSTLHSEIISSKTHRFEKSAKADLLAVSVKVFYGDKKTLIRENPSLLQEAPITARLGFPDVVLPGDNRNEVYVKLWEGHFFSQGNRIPGNQSNRSIQVTVELRRGDGTIVKNVISRGSGESLVSRFDSIVFQHEMRPSFGELFKLQMGSNEDVEKLHLFFTFRHRSSKEDRTQNGSGGGAATQYTEQSKEPFAHAYLPLFESSSSAFIRDGHHRLLLWRATRSTQHISPELYFALPAIAAEDEAISIPSSLATVIQPLRDVLLLRTYLVSTRYTQNENLLKLLHWEKVLSKGIDELKTVLTQFVFVSEVEIVKFLRDIFDALFGIVVNPKNGNGELDDVVFHLLVTVLGIIQDRRFNNFKATLDVYIDQHYHSQSAYTRLLGSMSRLLSDPIQTEKAESSKELRAAIKVWPHLFKFIIRGRENQRGVKDPLGDAVSDHLEASFKRDLDSLLRSINRLVSMSQPSSIIGTQTLVLQNFATLLPELARIFPLDELVRIETAFTDSIFMTRGRMAIWKLLHIMQITHDSLFDDTNSRSQLLPSIVRWIRPHLGRYEESLSQKDHQESTIRDAARIAWSEAARMGVTVIAVVLDKLQISLLQGKKGGSTQQQIRQDQDNVDYVLSMMPRLLETYKEFNSTKTGLAMERHRSPSTIISAIPVIFPSSYPFPLLARKPEGQVNPMQSTRSSRRHIRKDQSTYLNCGMGEIAAVLTVLVHLSPKRHLSGFLDEQLDVEGREKLTQFLFDFYQVTTSILSNEAFPNTWLNINILSHQMALKMADPLASLLVRDFIPIAEKSETFNTPLWQAGFNMLLTLLSSDQLVIERFNPQRRRAVWKLAGDIRGEGAQIFAKLWNSIGWPQTNNRTRDAIDDDTSRLNTGGFQVQFVPFLVEPVLELCLSHHDELRTCAVRVLATMITSEWHLNGHFQVIEAEIIDKLDVLFIADTQGDEISRAFFIGQLRSLFESTGVDPNLQEQVFSCLVGVNRFLDLLLSVRSLPLEEGFEDDRVAGTLKLLGFLRQSHRINAFSTHVLRLVNLHLENESFIEAALTLKLHADLHSWEMDQYVESIPDLDLPRQSQFARKETIYMLILDYLSKGKAWEISIDLCRELAREYEYRSVDYSKLAEILTLQASLFQKIGTEERIFPRYFKVRYYGTSWPASLQGKNFIYRGLDYERSVDFVERIHQKHPKSTLIKSHVDVGDDIRYSTTSIFIQIIAVEAEPDRTKEVFINMETPPLVRAYYEHNTTNLFSFSRPISNQTTMNGEKSDEDAIEMTWLEKTFLRVEDSFPTVLRRSEIVEVTKVKISPVESALSKVESRTKELETLQIKFINLSQNKLKGGGQNLNTNRLSMVLNEAVDAPIKESIPTYRRAFFSNDYIATHQEKEPMINKLRDAIDRQVTVIYQCLLLHSRLCPLEMRPFHDTLEKFYKQNFNEEIERLHLDIDAISEDVITSTSIDADGVSMDRGVSNPGMSGMVESISGESMSGASKATIVSPLQRHIAYLSQQAEPMKASPTSFDDHTKMTMMLNNSIDGINSSAMGLRSSGGAIQLPLTNTLFASNLNLAKGSSNSTKVIGDGIESRKTSGAENQSVSSKAQGSLFSKVTEGSVNRASRLFSRNKR